MKHMRHDMNDHSIRPAYETFATTEMRCNGATTQFPFCFLSCLVLLHQSPDASSMEHRGEMDTTDDMGSFL